MCKLCNTNRQPIKIGILSSKKTIKFSNIVKEYTNELPCRNCRNAFMEIRTKKKYADEWILKRLQASYIAMKGTSSEYTRAYSRVRKFENREMQAIRTYEQMENCIQKSTNHSTNHITYRVVVRRKKETYCKDLPTLEEARQFRNTIKES